MRELAVGTNNLFCFSFMYFYHDVLYTSILYVQYCIYVNVRVLYEYILVLLYSNNMKVFISTRVCTVQYDSIPYYSVYLHVIIYVHTLHSMGSSAQ